MDEFLGDAFVPSVSIWETAEQAPVVIRHRWTIISRIIPDILWIAANLICLVYLIIFSEISPGSPIGNVPETVLTFSIGVFGFPLMLLVFRAALAAHTACDVGDVKGVVRSLLCFTKW